MELYDKNDLNVDQIAERKQLEKSLKDLAEQPESAYRVKVDVEYLATLKLIAKDMHTTKGWVTFMGVLTLLGVIVGLLFSCNFF